MDYSQWTKLTASDFTDRKATNHQAALFGKNMESYLIELKVKDEESINHAIGWFFANADEDVFEHEMEDVEIEFIADQFRETLERRHDAFRIDTLDEKIVDSPPTTPS